jgi:hypothetical protein
VTDNPLTKFYTQVGMFVSLPSNGRFYSTTPTLTADKELEVFPMNAIDELQFQNPDGLLNNESLVKVIERTCPGIIDAHDIPKPDLDIILMALRMVTYGKSMDVEAKCKKCKNNASYSIDLSTIIATAKKIPEDTSVEVAGLSIFLKPYSLSSQNRLNEFMINIQRTARQMQSQGLDKLDADGQLDALKTQMGDSVRESAIELFNIATGSIERIIMPDETVVTDKDHISEWLNSIKAPEYKVIREMISSLSEEAIDRTFKYTCEKCETKNSTEVNFDPANFFALN